MLQAHSNEDEIAVGNLLGEKQDFSGEGATQLHPQSWCESNCEYLGLFLQSRLTTKANTIVQ